MRGRHERRTIDALLNEAEVLADDYGERDVAAMRERVLANPTLSPATSEPGGTEGSASPADGPTGGDAARPPAVRTPRYYSTECEQAAHDLDLAVSLVLNAPEAAASLSRFVEDEECAAPQGALVFAGLLHLARYREAAQFWWQFAAGGGSRTAAFCLYLHHRRHGEFRDADHWRAHSERLPRRPRTEGLPHPRGGTRSLLPDGVLHGLLSECHGGGRPRLPHALESVLHRLPVTDDDEDFGEIPQPARDLTRRLTASRPRH